MVPFIRIDDYGLFSDEVYSSTDLNRHAGEVLDHASKRPVTISRNREQFALLKREFAARLIETAVQVGPALDLVVDALDVIEGQDVPETKSWIKSFEPEDLSRMIREVLVASVAALRETGDWESVGAVIHEWRESALVEMSGVLDEAMHAHAEEAELPDPRSL